MLSQTTAAEGFDELNRLIENTRSGLILLANGLELGLEASDALRMIAANMDGAREQIAVLRHEAFTA